jgi:transcriptional regulator with XRE-family HTH domain
VIIVEQRYNEDLKGFGKRLKKYRIEKGLTQLELAEKMNIERSEISKIENGKSNIEFRTIVRLAIALDIPTSYLFVD